MVDGDEFRQQLSKWVASQGPKFKEELAIMEDIVLDIIKSTKNGKMYPQIKRMIK